MIRGRTMGGLLFTAAVLVSTSLNLFVHAESFDKPLQKKVIDLGLSDDFRPSDNIHLKLTCTYYPAFMVKQLEDTSSEGALGFWIVPAHLGHMRPCTQTHTDSEKSFGKKWCGYFSGVKRGVVFLDACDGFSGGIGFAAFDSKSGAKLFEDLVSAKNGTIDFVHISDEQVTLRYMRVVAGDCSVPKLGEACWNSFKKQPGLSDAPMPKCSDYEGAEAGIANSMIEYPVEVKLFPQPSIRALSNPAQCWAGD